MAKRAGTYMQRYLTAATDKLRNSLQFSARSVKEMDAALDLTVLAEDIGFSIKQISKWTKKAALAERKDAKQKQLSKERYWRRRDDRADPQLWSMP